MAATYEEIDWYDLPALYDIVFDVDTAREADFLEQVSQRYGTARGRRVLEPACGSGRLVLELARRGWSVYGTDLNAHMLTYARERLERAGLRATLRRADMSRPLPARQRFDLAHCLVSTFKYLTDEDAARGHLQSVASALRPGGVYVLGFHLSNYGDHGYTRERWVCERGPQRVVCNIQSWPPDRRTRLERVRSRLIVTEEGRERRSETHWDFRTYAAGEVRALLASVPDLEHLATYDFTYDLEHEIALDGEQLDVVLVLRRKG